MTDPAGSDRIQQDVPTASGTGDNSSTGDSFADVPLIREEAVERDSAHDDARQHHRPLSRPRAPAADPCRPATPPCAES